MLQDALQTAISPIQKLLELTRGVPSLLIDGEGYCRMTDTGSLPHDAGAYNIN